MRTRLILSALFVAALYPLWLSVQGAIDPQAMCVQQCVKKDARADSDTCESICSGALAGNTDLESLSRSAKGEKEDEEPESPESIRERLIYEARERNGQ